MLVRLARELAFYVWHAQALVRGAVVWWSNWQALSFGYLGCLGLLGPNVTVQKCSNHSWYTNEARTVPPPHFLAPLYLFDFVTPRGDGAVLFAPASSIIRPLLVLQ